jgi:transcriptional regulator with XRE-family HTH domain
MLLGTTARELREKLGLKQREVAKELGISVVHLCNIENNKAALSPALIDKYRERWGIDLYVLTWCQNGNLNKLPAGVRAAARNLANAFREEMDCETIFKDGERRCSISAK